MMLIMMIINFSEIKKNWEKIRFSKFGSWGRNKGFWLEYLPMPSNLFSACAIFVDCADCKIYQPLVQCLMLAHK